MCKETISQASKNFFKKDKSITIHQENLKYLAIEIYKVKMGISTKIMNEIFRFSKNSVYSLKSGTQLEKPSINTVQFGSESKEKSGNELTIY